MACALTVLGAGCQGYSTDFSTPVAIAIVTTRVPPLRLEDDDTLRVGVTVLDRAGDSVPGTHVRMISLDPDTVAVDSLTFAITAVRPGTGRVIALAGDLQSVPLVITVVPAPDSLKQVSAADTTVAAADSVSGPLVVQLLDTHTDIVPKGLSWNPIGDTVRFAIVFPVFDSLTVATVTLGNDSLAAAVVTGTVPGSASVVVRRQGPPPHADSVVVQATARRAAGTVRGSPVQFVVRFQ